MKSFLSSLTSRVTELNLRPLLYVAGAATAAAGLCYLYRRLADQQPRKTTVDAAVQTETEEPVHVMPQCSGEMRSSFWTLRVSHRRWYDRTTVMVSVKRDFVLLARGAVTQSWWTLTNDFFKPTSEGLFHYASVHRVTLALHIDGHLARVTSHSFTERISSSKSKGPHGVPVRKSFWVRKGIVIGYEGCLVSVPGGTDLMVHDPGSGRASAPEAAERLSVEERQAPALYYFCRTKGIENVLLKLTALRQASTIMLSQPHIRTFLEMSGRKILGELARANNEDLIELFYELYDILLQQIQETRNRIWLEVELAQIGIQHFNFIDIMFELVLLGILGRVRVFQICGVIDGFLDFLMEVIMFCTSSRQQRSNRGSRLIRRFQAEMLLLLETIFTMDDALYADPASLATELWDTFKFHIRQLLNVLE